MKKIIALLIIAFCAAAIIVPAKRKETNSQPASQNKSATAHALSVLKKSNAGLKRFTLDNGMICLVKEDSSAPVVSIQFWVGTGAINEKQYLGSGLCHAIEHMIFKGTETSDPGYISKAINDAGGDINAYTSYDRTVFHTDMPARNWKKGFAVLADALMNPSFPEEEWKKERNVIIREIAMGHDDPSRVIHKLIFRTAYTTHPYKYPIIGYEDTFKALSRDDLASFYSENYVSDNIIAVIVGDVDGAEVRKELETTFAAFKRKSREQVVLPSEPTQLAPRFERKTGDYKITRLEQVYHTVPLSHQDTPALDVLAEIIGRGRSSRLVQKIKEEQKLVLSISAFSYTPKAAGVFGISAEFSPEKEDEARTAIQKEIDSWRSEPFTVDEIEKAKRRLLSSALSQLQTMSGQASSYASGEFYAADPLYDETYFELLNKVTPEVLTAVVKKYIQDTKVSTAILSPRSEEKEDGPDKPSRAAVSEITKLELSNKIPLLVREDHKLPFVYISVAALGGLLSENESNAGITQLMSDLLTRGTATRTSAEIALATESLGGTINPFSGRNSLGINARCLSSDVETFLELISDCLKNPSFPEEELEKQRKVLSSALASKYDNPFYVARAALRKSIFPNHPYRFDTLGTEKSLKSLTRKDIQDHAARLIVDGNLVVSIFGDINAEKAEKLANKYFSGIRSGKKPDINLDAPAPKLPVVTEQREPREQAIVLIGFPGIDVKDPDYDAIDIVRTAMSGLSSELGTEIREKRGLAYFAGAFNVPGLAPGMYVMYAGTHEKAAPEVRKLMEAEIERVTTDGMKTEEIERARKQLITRHEEQLQDNLSIAMSCTLNELYGLGHKHFQETKARLTAVKAEEIKKATARILGTGKYAVSLTLPEKKQETESE